MEFARRAKKGGEEGKRQREAGGEEASGWGSIMEICLPKERYDQIIDRCHDPASISNFNPPMSLVHLLVREKTGLDFAKAGLGIFHCKQELDVFIQL